MIELNPYTIVMGEHTMTWDGPFGKTYIERCSCGWSAMTFAATRETGIGKAHDAHLAEVALSDGKVCE